MKNKLERIIAVLAVVVVLSGAFFLGHHWEAGRHSEPELKVSDISARLSDASDLATARLDYKGLIRYEEGQIRFLTKKSFTMLYAAQIRAGIDLSKAEIALTDDTITVTLPPAQLLSVEIDPDSLEFYDEKIALFNPEHREDTVLALQEAEKDAEAYARETDLQSHAEQQASRLVRELLEPLAEGDTPFVLAVRTAADAE